MTQIVSKPDHGEPIGDIDGKPVLASNSLQNFHDDLSEELNLNLLGNQVQLQTYTVSTLPSSATAGGLIFISDETGGPVPAFSDGTEWRRVTDRAIVS